MARNEISSPSGLYLFVGDIHGDVLSMQRALRYSEEHDTAVIFIGDYIDSRHYSRAEQKKCLEIIKENQDNDLLYFLRGNHELSYQRPDLYKVQAHSKSFHREIAHLINSISFLSFAVVNDYILITHAGLSKNFMEHSWSYDEEEFGGDNDILQYVTNVMRTESTTPSSDLFKAGRLSRGPLDVGGPFWCRPSKFSPIGEDIIQIFGHTSLKNILYYGKLRAYNIDALLGHDRQVLLYEEMSDSFAIETLI